MSSLLNSHVVSSEPEHVKAREEPWARMNLLSTGVISRQHSSGQRYRRAGVYKTRKEVGFKVRHQHEARG